MKDKPIIFDDLERCKLKDEEKLGVINLYVEHHGCHVIVIAHDEKLAESMAEAKEKIFGHSIQIAPEVEAAFKAFVSELPDMRARQYITTHKDDILSTFQESQALSLRILRHIIEDTGRLIGIMEAQHKKISKQLEKSSDCFAR